MKLLYVAAAAAKSLQSCPTLCDPKDGSPSGSAVPGILQGRTLEWVAISFSKTTKKTRNLIPRHLTQSALLVGAVNNYFTTTILKKKVHLFVTPMDCSTPGSPVLHYLTEFASTHAHWVDNANQPSILFHPLFSPNLLRKKGFQNLYLEILCI